MKNLDKILNDLQLNDKFNDLIKDKNQIQNIFSKKEIETLQPHLKFLSAVFLLKKNPFILFFENPENEKELHKWIWNFNKTAVVFIIKNETLNILNGFILNENGFLNQLESQDNKQNFNYFNLVTGQTWEIYNENLKYQNRVDYKLLKSIEGLRNAIINELEQNEILKSFNNSNSLINSITNKLIGRLLFIRYLIDRKIKIHFPEINSNFNQFDLINVLKNPQKTYKLFWHLREKFNGDLFPFTEEKKEYQNIREEDFITQNILQLFIELFDGGDIKFKYNKKIEIQKSLFQFYDFSIIPVEFISNIYEQFIGVDNQKDKGAYYTPVFLVNYILEKTVKKHFENNNIIICKVLDPACGSSIFLVETLRTIIEKYQHLNPNYYLDLENYKEDLRNLVKENIFGIDSDPNAIDVSIFSIYITLLDYQNPADIESFKLPPLKNTNFFVADFFDTEHKFNQLQKFDFIVGNPPWGKVEDSILLYKKYFKQRSKKESIEKNEKIEIKIADEQIAQAFVLRASDFSKQETEIAFLVTSKILYNLQSIDFRKYLLNNFFINEIFEISSVRHQVFDKSTNDKAVAPACVIMYKYSNGVDTSQNIVNHISLKPNLYFKLFKIFVIEKNDQKKVEQTKFLKHDWLFKLLVYGNVHDFNLIKRLKTEYQTIFNLISDKNNFVFGKGICLNGIDKNKPKNIGNLKHLVGKPYIDTKQKRLKSFFIDFNEINYWNEESAHCSRNPNLYEIPFLLIKKGLIVENLNCVNALILEPIKINNIFFEKLAFTDSVTSIKLLNSEKIDVLKNICGYLGSNFFSYYILQIGSSTAIEREQSHDKDEKLSFPYTFSNNIANIITQIEQTKKQIYEKSKLPESERLILEKQDKELLEKLNEEVYNAFEISDLERAIIDYSLEISIPLVQQQNNNYPVQQLRFDNEEHQNYLKQYAQIYLDIFSHRFANNFGVEILHSNYAICIKFYHSFEKINEKIILKNEKIENIYTKFLKTASTKITEELYIQKDVRGFESNAFYIVKPNQRKLWHKAMAWDDAFEFSDVLNEMKMKKQYGTK